MTCPDHEIAIIGAGLSGLGIAAALRHADLTDFVILERADDVGGTWRANTYPGVAVDIPTFTYQFSYEPRADWSHLYARGSEVKQYIDDFVHEYGLRRHLRLGVEVAERVWDESRHLWRLVLGDGSTVTARYVVGAIGVFPEPRPVTIPRLEAFAGKTLVSMDWDHDFDLTGKRVAVIGTGASALQIVPAIAPIVEHLDVYQRTPIWVSPKWDPEIPRWVHRLLSGLPILQRAASGFFGALIEFYVLRLNLRYSEHAALMDRFQQRLVRFLERCVPDDDVRTRLRPTYALGCKRPSFSNTYYSTFMRDNVDLVTDPIERFTVDGVRTADGAARPIDAVVLATGFLVAFDPEVYRRRPVRGRDGFDLAAHWERNRVSAYHGITVPKLPNHFLVVGPYSTVARSFHAQVEIAADHLIRVIREARRRCATSVEIRQEAHDREHRHLLNGLRGSLWHGGRCDGSRTYYVDPHGDVTYFRPQTTKAARRAARTFPLDDYRYDSLAPQSNEPSTIAPAVDDTEALGHS